MTDSAAQVRRALLLLDDGRAGRRWCRFSDPVRVITAWQVGEVVDALDAVDEAVAQGYWCVGMVSYDAAAAFDPALVAHRHARVPLVAFGVFAGPVVDAPAVGRLGGRYRVGEWWPELAERDHGWMVETIRDQIAAGDVYQVNLTLRLHAAFSGDPAGLFGAMARAQRGDHMAYLDLGDRAVCSASPELLLRRDGDSVVSRPMKGTRPRHPDPVADEALAEQLRHSVKDLAENTMIVDMVRNDLGRVARAGSVAVPELHTVERYPTVHQMTSTVTARFAGGTAALFEAVFPAASITGAPKVAASRSIAALESSARGVYCGTVGCVSPEGWAEFNVAIRTAWVDLALERVEYGVGGGIVWDSRPEEEWREVQAKARILHRVDPDLALIETMRAGTEGIDLLDRHLDRLVRSAGVFGIPVDRAMVRDRLEQACRAQAQREPARLRLTLDPWGAVTVTAGPIERADGWRLPVALGSVRSSDESLFHKTTRRAAYEAARARFPEAPDVVCVNERGEVTETTIGNLLVLIDGRWVTPSEHCGLLPGTLRAELLARGEIEERVVTVAELIAAPAVQLINSVRGRVPVTILEPTMHEHLGGEPHDLGDTKAELRRALRARRGAVDAADRRVRSVALWRNVLASRHVEHARTVAAFWGFGSEPDTEPLAELLAGRRLVFPRVEADRLVFATGEAGMRRSRLGVMEPEGPEVPLDEIDVMLVPGLGFDRLGRRIGYGAGFYDRLLARIGAPTIGVCLAEQVVDSVPVGPMDLPVDLVISDRGPEPTLDLDGVSVLSFDCYGTLIDWERGIEEALRQEGLPDALERFAALETLVQAEDPTLAYPAVLAATATRLGLDDAAAARFGASVPAWPAFADTPEALARLAARFRLVILSNIDRRSFVSSEARLVTAGASFAGVFTAEEIGSYKPDPRNFEYLAARLAEWGVGPEAHVHVAQSRFHDITPAAATGLRTVWIDRRRGRVGGATPVSTGADPTWRFTTLGDFADAVT